MATTDAKLRLVIEAQDKTGNIFSAIAAKAKEAAASISKAIESAGVASSGTQGNMTKALAGMSDQVLLLSDSFRKNVNDIQQSWNGVIQLPAPNIAGLLAAENVRVQQEVSTSTALLGSLKDTMDQIRATSTARAAPDTVYTMPPQMLGAGGGGAGGAGGASAFTGMGDGARASSEAVQGFSQSLASSRDQVMSLLGALSALRPELGINLEQAASMSNARLGEFASQMTGVKTTVGETVPQVSTLEQVMELQGLAQASDTIKGWGTAVLDFLGQGVDQSKQFEVSTVDLKDALKVNMGMYRQSGDQAIASNQALDVTMGQLSNKATDLGKAYMFNENQAQEMFYSLASSGVPAKAIMDGVGESTMQLAQATRTDLIPTTNVLASTYHQFGRSLKESFGEDTNKAFGYVSDTLTNVRLLTHESLGDIAGSLKYVAPAIDGTRIQFGDLGTAMALLARNGIQSSMAGTALRRMFTNLHPVSKAAAKAMEDVGIITKDGTNRFFDASGKMKSMTEIMAVLNETIGQRGDAERNAAIHDIFGQYALQAMSVLARTGAGSFDELKDKVTQSGTAAAVSQDQMNTLSGKLDVMGENWTIIKKKIGDALQESLKPMVDKLVTITQVVIDFIQTHPQLTTWIAKFAAIAGVVLVVAGTIGGFVATIGLMAAGWASGVKAIKAGVEIFEKFGKSILGVGRALITFVVENPIPALIIAIIVVIAILAYEIYKHWGQIKQFLTTTWTTIKTTATDVWNGLKTYFTNLWNETKKVFTDAWDSLKKSASDMWDGMIKGIQKLWTEFKVWIVIAVLGIVGAIIEAFLWMYNHNYYFKDLVDFIVKWFKILKDDAVKIWTEVTTWLSTTWNRIKNDATVAWNAVVTFLRNLWNSIVAIVVPIWNSISGTISRVWNAISSTTSAVWNQITGDLRRVWNGIVELVQGVWDKVSGAVEKAWDTVRDKVRAGIDKVKNEIDGLWADAEKWGSKMVTMLANGINSEISKVTSAATGVAKEVWKFLGFHSPTKEGPGSDADQWAPNFMKMFANGIDDHRDLLQKSMNGVALDMHSTVGVDKGGLPVAGSRSGGGSAPVFNITINSNGKNGDDLANEFVNAVRRYVPVVTY